MPASQSGSPTRASTSRGVSTKRGSPAAARCQVRARATTAARQAVSASLRSSSAWCEVGEDVEIGVAGPGDRGVVRADPRASAAASPARRAGWRTGGRARRRPSRRSARRPGRCRRAGPGGRRSGRPVPSSSVAQPATRARRSSPGSPIVATASSNRSTSAPRGGVGDGRGPEVTEVRGQGALQAGVAREGRRHRVGGVGVGVADAGAVVGEEEPPVVDGERASRRRPGRGGRSGRAAGPRAPCPARAP